MLSRVADNLYWLSRYLERAEHTARLLSIHLVQQLDQTPESAERRWERMASSLRLPTDGTLEPYALTKMMTFDQTNPNSILNCVSAARENGRQVRSQLSSEMWLQLNRLHHRLQSSSMAQIWPVAPYQFFDSLKDGIHLFDGITQATLLQEEGWHFMAIGRYLERALQTCWLLETYYEAALAPEYTAVSALEWSGLLRTCTSFEAYCRRYTALLRPDRIADFLLLNPTSPRSICFAVANCHHAIVALGPSGDNSQQTPQRLAGRLLATLTYGDIGEIMADGLSEHLAFIRQQLARIDTAIYETYIQHQRDLTLPV